MLRYVGDAGCRIHHGVTVPVLIQVVHPHLLILVPVLVIKPEFLVILRIMDIAEVAAGKLKNRHGLPVLKRVNGKVPVVVLVGVDDISFLVKCVKGIFLVIALGAEYCVHFFPVLRPACYVLVIGCDMQVIEAVEKDRGIFPLDSPGNPDAATFVINGVLVIVVVIHLSPGSVNRNLFPVLFLYDVLNPVPRVSLVDIDHLDIV